MPIVRVNLGKVPMALLRQLHETGLYGFTIENVAEDLILGRLREFLREGDRTLQIPQIRKSTRKK